MQAVTQPSGTIRQIVLIDDEPSVLFALKLLLQALGYSVYDFNSPMDGVAFLNTAKPVDLCLCDLKMPDMNGLGVLEATRKVRPSLPFVLMSGHATAEEIDRSKQLGATGFLSKPFTPDELKQLVQRISEQNSKR